jgi:hypothetical protein
MEDLIIRNLNLNGNAAKRNSLMALECWNTRMLADSRSIWMLSARIAKVVSARITSKP